MTDRRLATAVGLSAVAMWSLLGLFATSTGKVPPFLLNALAFGVSGVVATAVLAGRGELGVLRQPPKVWLLGVGGLFGFHALYFTSLRLAPPVEANLVNYTWPLLIVIFSGLLPGERLKAHHIAGAALGLVGAAAIVTKGQGIALEGTHALGYGAAICSALTWAGYSVLSRLFGAVPTATVAGFCLATSILSAICHIAFETTVWPQGLSEWAAVAALGLFPVGLAFFVWDFGVKRGDIQVLGAASYLSPLLSTLFLILAGRGVFTWVIGFAAIAITAGAIVASKDMLLRRTKASDATA